MGELWTNLVAGRSQFFTYAVVPTIVVTLAYLSGSLVCFVIERSAVFRKHKIQARTADRATWWQCLRHVFFHKLTSEIPLTFGAYPVFVWVGVKSDLPLPDAATVMLTLLGCFVVEDAWHYFAHRTLHGRWAYKKIHHIHHRYTAPFGAAANYAHPLETLFTGFGTVLPVILFRPHLFTMLIWIVARQWQAISVHLGFDLPFRLCRVLPFLGGARFHDRHHEKFNANFAPTFVWLDRILGTADEKDLGVHPVPAASQSQRIV